MPDDGMMIRSYNINKHDTGESCNLADVVVVEEPLEIKLAYSTATGYLRKTIAITMRTPGCDEALATGFLFTEGILTPEAVKKLSIKNTHDPNSILIQAPENYLPQLQNAERNFYSHSSCGICGKTNIESTRQLSPFEFVIAF